jgi:hypothetical protein
MINTLKLDPFTRANWGEYDAYAISQHEPLMYDPCFRPRLYVAPDLTANQLQNTPPGVSPVNSEGAYVEYGLSITPGSLIVASRIFSLPSTVPSPGFVQATVPMSFLVQMTDLSLNHKLFDKPIPALLLSNAKGDQWNIWDTPHPVVGSGLFRMEFWNQDYLPQIMQLILAVLEPCDPQ